MAATIVSTHERATAAERILRAAVALFRERGYHGSSMRTLARALRMEAASLYYHFKSKQEILFAILDRTLDDLLAGVGRTVASADGPEARLRAAARDKDFSRARQPAALPSAPPAGGDGGSQRFRTFADGVRPGGRGAPLDAIHAGAS